VISPYIVNKRAELKVIVIWDVFKDQMIPAVKVELEVKDIELVPVPAKPRISLTMALF